MGFKGYKTTVLANLYTYLSFYINFIKYKVNLEHIYVKSLQTLLFSLSCL